MLKIRKSEFSELTRCGVAPIYYLYKFSGSRNLKIKMAMAVLVLGIPRNLGQLSEYFIRYGFGFEPVLIILSGRKSLGITEDFRFHTHIKTCTHTSIIEKKISIELLKGY